MINEKLKEESKRIRREVRSQTIGYIIPAFGLVAGLAWNEAIKSVIDKFFSDGQSIGAKFIYAIVITLVIVVLSMYLMRMKEKGQE